MLNRNVSLVVCLSVLAGAGFAQTSNQGTGYVFQFAYPTAGSGQFQAFIYNNSSLGTPVFTATGPAGANQVIAKPDGSKFYVVGTGGVDDFNPSFTTSAAVNGLSGSPYPGESIISPDGRYLLVPSSVGSGSGAVYILNATTDVVALNQAVSGSVIGVVVSRDSTTAWILSDDSGNSVITVVNLPAQGNPQQVGSPVFLRDPITGDSLAGNAQALALSPLGLLYVTAGNQVLEIIPSTLTTSKPSFVAIPVNATPGAPKFSTDGSMMYMFNTTASFGGESLVNISLPAHGVTYWPTSNNGQTPEQFDSIFVASPTRLFAHSPGDTTLWDVSSDLTTALPNCTQAVCVSALNSVLPATTVVSATLSNELPTKQYLYLLVSGGGSQASLYSVNLSTNTVNSQASAALGLGTLQFSIVPPETSPTSFISLTPAQTNLAPGAVAQPLIARVLDPLGRPMFNVPVTFTGDPSLIWTGGTAITDGVSENSNEDGYVQTTVTMGTSTEPPGAYPVTLTAGSGSGVATTTFTLTIPGGSIGPPGVGGSNQMTIISGDGQLFQELNAHSNGISPLAVQLLDTSGNPLANQSVTFTIVGPQIGALDNPNATTDVNGMASTDFFPEVIPQNTGFQGTTITAVATQGAVTFNETVYQLNGDDITGGASAFVEQPTGYQTINAGEGDVVPNAIAAVVYSNSFGQSLPIPNVAVNIVSPDYTGNAGPATCQGIPLSDATGTVTCNLIASCSAGLGLHPFFITVGNLYTFTGYSINVTEGSTQALAIKSGNSQSGRPGTVLPLTATVTDKCGSPAQGITVTWKVVQGSATLSSSSTVSNQGGTVSTNLTLGQAPGSVQIVATINSATTVTYTETTLAVVGSLTLASGGGQNALLNQPFPAPLVFQLRDASNNPVSGLAVTFSLAGGSAALSTTTGTTNAQGQVSVNVTAGNTAGNVTILATYSTFTASASLTVTAPGPTITVSSFVNAASGQAGLTPCGLALVTGSGLAPGITGVVVGNPLNIGPLPTNLAGVTITVNGSPAPLQAVSNQNGLQQVNFQTPCETVPGSPATVVVQVGTVSTQITNVTVYPAQPGIFTFASSTGAAYGWVINASNASYITPTNLAHAGQTYYLVATGLGQTTPAAITDTPGSGSQTISPSNVILAIDNIGVPVTSVQYLEGAFGEYVITFTIPAVVNGAPFPTGTNLPISLGITVNGQTFYDNSPVALPGIQ